MSIRQVLQQNFKLQEFRAGQQQVIEALLAGRSALAVFPTGGGKSLCYQLPALMLDGLTLVVSPLIALMKDQVDRLVALGIAAARLDSSVDGEELSGLYRALADGRIKLLYVAPERLANERFLARLQRLSISMMAVDEAHCVSEWGHNFRPDYLKLAQLAQQLKVGRVLALTATATPAVAGQICSSFGIAAEDHIQTGFYRPNLALTVTACSLEERDRRLLAQIAARPVESAIVYVTLQKTAEHVAQMLLRQGHSAGAYHAGLKDEERHRIQEAFMQGDVHIVVATIAFGMGIDKSDIRAVYHYNLPKSLENYMQEIGRAGRDGKPSHCELLANATDLTTLENFVYGDTPEPSALDSLVRWLLTQPTEFDISVYQLSQQFDVRPLVIRTLLTYLELEGVLRATAPFYSEYKIAFRDSSDSILARFNESRAEFLRRLFASGRQARTWLTLLPAEAAQQLGEQRARIVNALSYLEQQQLIELRVAGVRQGYRRQNSGVDIEAVIERMMQRFWQREQSDIQRLEQVCQWLQGSTCLQQSLVVYFGETLATPCGHCSACDKLVARLPQRQQVLPNETLLRSVYAEGHGALATPRQLARFLCGISSPLASRARLAGHPKFGALAATSFQAVLEACGRLAAK